MSATTARIATIRPLAASPDVQYFYVTVLHANVFATAGNTGTDNYAEWFELARKVSLDYPRAEVRCDTLARIRRIYQAGRIVKDWPDYPYTGRTTEQW